jgi:uncharacterized membrane protein YdfJ with MMPL/SSD domain
MINLGSGRLFGIAYLLAWMAALAVLVYFLPDISRVVSILLSLVLGAVAPDLGMLKRLLSGREDAKPGDARD